MLEFILASILTIGAVAAAAGTNQETPASRCEAKVIKADSELGQVVEEICGDAGDRRAILKCSTDECVLEVIQ